MFGLNKLKKYIADCKRKKIYESVKHRVSNRHWDRTCIFCGKRDDAVRKEVYDKSVYKGEFPRTFYYHHSFHPKCLLDVLANQCKHSEDKIYKAMQLINTDYFKRINAKVTARNFKTLLKDLDTI